VTDEISLTLRQVTRMPPFYLLLGAQLFGNFVNPALNLHMIPFFTDQGLSSATAVTATTTLFISGALGSLIFGLLAERFGIKPVLTLNYVLTGVGFGLLLLVHAPIGAILWGAFMGIVQGGGQTLNQVIFPDYFGRGSLGAIRGAVTPITLGANASGPLVAAIAFDATGSYFAIFAIFGFFRVASALLVVLAKAPPGSAAEQAQSRRATPAN
jgi:MFS family permease